jgi:hypothetical protein
VSVYLETVLITKQDRCTICVERTIGSEIILDTPDVTWIKWKLVSVHLETMLTSTQDRCTVCVERAICSKIILDAPDGSPRLRGSSGSYFGSVWKLCLSQHKIGAWFVPKYTIGLEIFLGALDGSPSSRQSSGSSFSQFGDSVNLDAR